MPYFHRLLIVFLTFVISLTSSNIVLAKNKKSSSKIKTLTVYTNRSFAKDWSGGKHSLKLTFEEKCHCKVQFVSLDSGGTLVSRLLLEGKNSKADIVLGIDTNLAGQALNTGLFAKHNVDTSVLKLPISWQDEYFLPYDYGYFAFVYDENHLKTPPKSLDELINGNNKLKIILQDPRSSTIGLGFLLWMKEIYGDKVKEQWKKLNPKIVTITKGWSESYALFLKGEADLVLGFTTTPAYHLIAEKKQNYKAAEFTEGSFLQVELIAKLQNSPNPELADMFMNFVTSQEFQKNIPLANFMYPTIDIGEDMPGEYKQLYTPSKTLFILPEIVANNKSIWVKEWLNSALKN